MVFEDNTLIRPLTLSEAQFQLFIPPQAARVSDPLAWGLHIASPRQQTSPTLLRQTALAAVNPVNLVNPLTRLTDAMLAVLI